MERTDWLDEGLDSADARFLMLTGSPITSSVPRSGGSVRSASSMPNSPSLMCWRPGRSLISPCPYPKGAGRASAHLPEPVLSQPRRRRTSKQLQAEPFDQGSTPYTAA